MMRISIITNEDKTMNLFKTLLILLLIPTTTELKAQDSSKVQENLKVGNLFEVFNHDSIRVYCSVIGRTMSKEGANFVRVGKRDPIFMNVVNEFKDYDLKGRLIFKGNMQNSNLNGNAAYFHTNGKVKEEGKYKNDLKDGTWKYYHPNGQLSQIVDFDNDMMNIRETYSKSGSPEVINGNGKLKITVARFNQFSTDEVSGTLKDGRMDGKWKSYTYVFNRILAIEHYEDGVFIKGEENTLPGQRPYTNNPSISLFRYYPNESFDLSYGVDGDGSWKYKGSSGLERMQSIYKLLLKAINDQYKTPLADQWVTMGFKITADDHITDINISSSIHDEKFNKFLHQVFAESTGWESSTAFGTKEVSTDIVLSLIVRDNKIVLPAVFNVWIPFKTDKIRKELLYQELLKNQHMFDTP